MIPIGTYFWPIHILGPFEKETSHFSKDAESGLSQRSGLNVWAFLKISSELWTKLPAIPTMVCGWTISKACAGGIGYLRLGESEHH